MFLNSLFRCVTTNPSYSHRERVLSQEHDHTFRLSSSLPTTTRPEIASSCLPFNTWEGFFVCAFHTMMVLSHDPLHTQFSLYCTSAYTCKLWSFSTATHRPSSDQTLIVQSWLPLWVFLTLQQKVLDTFQRSQCKESLLLHVWWIISFFSQFLNGIGVVEQRRKKKI